MGPRASAHVASLGHLKSARGQHLVKGDGLKPTGLEVLSGLSPGLLKSLHPGQLLGLHLGALAEALGQGHQGEEGGGGGFGEEHRSGSFRWY